MKKFFFVSLGVCAAILAAWFSPWVQEWKHGAIEKAYVQHYEAKHMPPPHEHGYDQLMFPEYEAAPDTVWVEDGRIEMEPFPELEAEHEHFGVDTDTLIARLSDEHLMDKLLDHANTLAVIITVLGTAIANIYWKFKAGPK